MPNLAGNATYPWLSIKSTTLSLEKTMKEAFSNELSLISHQKHGYNLANSIEISSKSPLVLA